MELKSIVLINGLSFSVDGKEVIRIFMFNNDTGMTHVTLSDETIVNIPYHSVLYWV